MENLWYHRRVAESATKSCMICFRQSSSVLITPDSKDYFYICPSHLRDRNFALPTEDEAKAVEDRRKKEEMDKEIAKIKAEYEEKLKKKQAAKGKDKGDKKEAEKEADKSEEQLEKEKQEKIDSVSKKKEDEKVEDGPRVFRLQKHFYNMRLEKMRTAELAKRNRERLRNPGTFPSVPTGDLGGTAPG